MQPTSSKNRKWCHLGQHGGKKKFNGCYQKYCPYSCMLYVIVERKKSHPCPEEGKEYSLQLLQSEEHTVRRRNRGGCGKVKERSRDSPLMSIWRVFFLSRDLFVLLLIPQSCIPPSLCEKMFLQHDAIHRDS